MDKEVTGVRRQAAEAICGVRPGPEGLNQEAREAAHIAEYGDSNKRGPGGMENWAESGWH